MARAPSRPPRRSGTGFDPYDPFADDPRVGRLPDRDVDPDEGGVDKAGPPKTGKNAVRAFIDDALVETHERTVEKFKRMRAKTRTKDGKIRRAKLIGAVLGLQLEGFKRQEIAAILGLTPMVVTKALRMAHQNKTVADLLRQLDDETVPLAVANVHQAVADGDLRQSNKVLEGRGLYRTHKSIDAQVTQTKIDIRLITVRPKHLDASVPLPACKPGSLQIGPPAITVTPTKVEDATPTPPRTAPPA